MNIRRELDKLGYTYGRVKNENPHLVYPAMTLASIAGGFMGAVNQNNIHMYGFTALTSWTFYNSLISFDNRHKLAAAKKILAKSTDASLAYIEKIIIEDEDGLETILSKTRDSKRREWATVLHANADGNIARVTEILDNDVALKDGLVLRQGRIRITYDGRLIKERGFEGTHHYHPNQFFYTENFAINTMDRAAFPDGIHLLTFNTPKGPEIIGYNTRYTYLPLDKTKKELVRADSKEIMRYISTVYG